jgi:hypothetical protein
LWEKPAAPNINETQEFSSDYQINQKVKTAIQGLEKNVQTLF